MPGIIDWGMCEVSDTVECPTSLTKMCEVSDTVECLITLTGTHG